MKKNYIKPSTETVLVRLNGSVMQPDDPSMQEGSVYTGSGLGKENKAEIEEEEGLINPTQPNLWDDEEE